MSDVLLLKITLLLVKRHIGFNRKIILIFKIVKFYYCKLFTHTDIKFLQILYVYTVCCYLSCTIVEMTISISYKRLNE